MAHDVVFSEVLCFIRNNFDKLTAGDIKPVLCSFYDFDDLDTAKECLKKAVQEALQASGDNTPLPRLPKRQGDAKGKQTAEDLLKLFTVIDERKLGDVLPRFVAEDLSRIPFVNTDSVNVLAMAKKLENLEMRVNSVERFLNSTCNETPSVPSVPSYSGAVLSGSTTASYDGTDMAYDGYSGASNGTTPNGNTDHTDGTEVAYHGNSADNADWKTVSNRRQKKPNTGRTTIRVPNKENSSRKIFGSRSANDSNLKAGVEIIQKAVLHVDNLHQDCTEALLKDYLLASEVQVLTCYPAKSWLRGEDRDSVSAFRVCVPAGDKHKICNPELWSKGVIIRDWKFTSKK